MRAAQLGGGHRQLEAQQDRRHQVPHRRALMALKENRDVQINAHTTQNIELTFEDEYNTDKLC
ncbi:MAG: hypothetical protein ACKPKO_29750, partial [Candidatus Fonsibacter sp.]